MKTYEAVYNKSVYKVVEAYEENGKYILAIYTKRAFLCATRSGKTAVESTWNKTVKEFQDPTQANNYFKGIKKNTPNLKEVK